jgi:hypothetical protein
MPPTEDEAEFVLADELAEVPMLLRLDPPPWPIPTDEEPDVDPDDELAVVSACAACPMQNSTAHASCNVVLVMMLLRKEGERDAKGDPLKRFEFLWFCGEAEPGRRITDRAPPLYIDKRGL